MKTHLAMKKSDRDKMDLHRHSVLYTGNLVEKMLFRENPDLNISRQSGYNLCPDSTLDIPSNIVLIRVIHFPSAPYQYVPTNLSTPIFLVVIDFTVPSSAESHTIFTSKLSNEARGGVELNFLPDLLFRRCFAHDDWYGQFSATMQCKDFI